MEHTESAFPRGRRMPRDARRTQVLAVAQDLFASEGYHHVSMDDIAERAEVSKPVLYRHFPSKLDLYLAVVDERGSGLLAAVEAALAPIKNGPVRPGDGRAVVHAIVRAYFDFVEGAGESASLLFESDVTHDAAVRVRVDAAGAEAARGIGRVLVDFTGLPAPQATLLATALVGLAQSGATSRLRTDPGLSVDAAADLVARLAWGGVAGLIRADYDYDLPG
ncbi:TetR/AcrR family transcriptional regulator [Pengzhenrongella frigida]|uniref:TetR/AcrR family transcriptional regulator n=1 Tax=Pengzhenrongella frigida TaxID=1259133 RepID=A0A4Q5N274_9MICO|nr:TetR/AcrR family transcriptional regulator [Cellulomonas sp. HLT2-17]RYV52268.1 TetR/AcrR family transcriptional regulator [Cellulomonas sp. HLT2-17]